MFDIKKFIMCLEDAGFTPFSYSGRYMYGKRCIAVQADNVKVCLAIGYEVGVAGLGCPELCDIKVDDMGKGVVIYWPQIEYKEK